MDSGNGAWTPGLVPLRPLAVTEILDGAVRVVWARRAAVFALAAPLAVAVAVVRALASYASVGDLSFALPSLAAQLLLPALLGTIVTGLIAPVVSGAAIGDDVGPGDSVRRVAGLAPGLVVLAVVLTVCEGVGLTVLLVGGAFLWGIWAVAAPAAVAERLGPFAALRRSFTLVRGDFWRAWGTRALGWLVTYVVAAVATVPFELLALAVSGGDPFEDASVDRPLLYLAVVAIGQVIACLLTVPVSSAIDVLLYLDLRMRREGMDIVMALPPAPPPATEYLPPRVGPQW